MKAIVISGHVILAMLFMAFTLPSDAQSGKSIVWNHQGNAYYQLKSSQIVCISLPYQKETIIASQENLKSLGNSILAIKKLSVSNNDALLLLLTDTKRGFNNTISGNYWVYQLKDGSLEQLGKSLPIGSLMFAKFSPDSKRAAYISGNNLYVEDLTNHSIKKLTNNGDKKLFNGRFDWVYEQEFDCRDGYRWSPDSRKIAYWQIDDRDMKEYLLLNTTDSIYPQAIKITSPIAGERPAKCRIGVIDISTTSNKWMSLSADTGLGSYIPRMEWAPNSK